MTAILTGPRKSGRSLLARIFAAKSGGAIIDEAERQPEEALFHAWNRAQADRRPLILIADAPPPEWTVALPDLRSRLAASPVATIGPPDDELIRALLEREFQRRSLDARPDLIEWLAARDRAQACRGPAGGGGTGRSGARAPAAADRGTGAHLIVTTCVYVPVMTRPAHIARLDADDDPFDEGAGSDRYFNRELSWLAFNRRVLEEACNAAHPLLERLRFLSISGSNLDEFFMVRVAGLKGQQLQDVEQRSADGMTPGQQLAAITAEADRLMASQQAVWDDIRHLLADQGIAVLGSRALDTKLAGDALQWLETHFREQIFPILTPQALDPAHPFPVHAQQGPGGDVRPDPPVGRRADPRAGDAARRDAAASCACRASRRATSRSNRS